MENERNRTNNFEKLEPSIAFPKQKKDWIYLPTDDPYHYVKQCKISYEPKEYLETINRISIDLGAEVAVSQTKEIYPDPLQVYKKCIYLDNENNEPRYNYEYVRKILTRPILPVGKKTIPGYCYEYSNEDPIVQALIGTEEPVKKESYTGPIEYSNYPYDLCQTKLDVKMPASETKRVQISFDFAMDVPADIKKSKGDFQGKNRIEYDCEFSFWLLASYLDNNKERLQDKKVWEALRQYLDLLTIDEKNSTLVDLHEQCKEYTSSPEDIDVKIIRTSLDTSEFVIENKGHLDKRKTRDHIVTLASVAMDNQRVLALAKKPEWNKRKLH